MSLPIANRTIYHTASELSTNLTCLKPKTIHVDLPDGHTMPVIKVGQGDPVILLHGFGMSAGAWLPFVLPLATQNTFYMPYLRGFSKAALTPFSKNDFVLQYAQDVMAMRKQLNLTSLKIGGISMGALTALKLNEIGGFGGVSHYLHIDQSPVMRSVDDWPWGVFGKKNAIFYSELAHLVEHAASETGKPFEALPKLLKRHITKTSAIMIGNSFATPGFGALSKLMCWFPDHIGSLRDNRGWQQQLHAIKGYLNHDYDFRSSLGTLTANTTVLIGEKSKLYDPEGQIAFTRLLPNANCVIVKGAGHALIMDKPSKFFQELKYFCSA